MPIVIQDSLNNGCESVSYGASTYVWCQGSSHERGKHPIFVSSPVRFQHETAGRFTVLSCHHEDCSVYGKPTRYEENEIRFQDGYIPRVEVKR
ncbi:MAG TPA: hypothetical protein VN684_11580 [Terriglobales bacterium]|nr:hypothetical protein [Terriglobales bacterium]